MTERHFQRHLRAALAAVERETPSYHAAMVSALGPRVVLAEVDDECVALRTAGGRVQLDADAPAPSVLARSTHASLRALLAGAESVTEALLAGRLFLQGALADLLALETALGHFLRGAVRAPSLPLVLASYRRPGEEAHVDR